LGKDTQRRVLPRKWPGWIVVGSASMAVFAIVVFLVVRNYGETLVPPASIAQGPATTSAQASDIFLRVLIALTAVIVLGRVLGRLFAYVGQPPVIGEVVAGILLGPSLIGAKLSSLVLPSSAAPYLGIVAQLGVVLYMFLVGLELNPALLRSRTRAIVGTSQAGILAPFVLGSALALYVYPRLSSSDVSFTSFALFMGVAMSITAFPVLARILGDFRLTRTKLGVVALSCAAVDDVTAWCLLAFVVGVTKAQAGNALIVVAGAVIYIAFMFLVGRPGLAWIARRWAGDQHSPTLAAVIFVALLLSAITAQAIGIHAIFGAFILGAIIPHDSAIARSLTHQLKNLVTILLLPAFFAFTGMRTRIDLLSQPSLWLIFGALLLAATLGKFGGVFAAARVNGLSWHSSAMLGTLMNTRGLMELIVLNVGLDLGVISRELYALMVLVALATTVLTSPLLRWLKGRTPPLEQMEMLSELDSESHKGRHESIAP
jgi:Kef-type K+ transport system membrane component KefB